jgi:hypothetical protein
VLFNLKSLSAQVVSAATSSSWDHCGIVYEEDGKTFLLEAVSAGGVQAPEVCVLVVVVLWHVSRWVFVQLNSRLLDALAQGAKLGFRRLLLPRSAEV